ncbi:CobW family GTP-binding protein [Allostreptomyces psammosilenae]|uniref:G3E family GTPase n=1 Tax=Allostreptomyces psammosilenae TaxID=1892865 RepID=A0A852ZNZ8_9ACTN|nr:GTP-binding protein [Allostreptomyces psammosilenae]NYI03187.1 G3E family GTPase [Allostreptomyces psammosilenae]
MPSARPARLPVSLLTGLAVDAKARTARAARRRVPGLAVVEVAFGPADGAAPGACGLVRWSVTHPDGRTDDGGVELEHLCVSCAVGEAVLPRLLDLAGDGGVRQVLLVLPPQMEADAFLHAFFASDVDGVPIARSVAIDTVACVVDLARVVDDLAGGERLADRGMALAPEDHRAVAVLAADHVEAADVLVCADTEPDVIDSARAQALLHHVNPRARHLRMVPDPVHGLQPPSVDAFLGAWSFDIELLGLRDEAVGVPHPVPGEEDGVVTTLWRARRPFHPRRLYDALEEVMAGVLRGRGHLWLAGRPDEVLVWESAGEHLAIVPGGPWLPEADTGPDAEAWQEVSPERRTLASFHWDPYYGERRSELRFTGIGLDVPSLHRVLDAALVTDEELADGERIRRAAAEDPFAVLGGGEERG